MTENVKNIYQKGQTSIDWNHMESMFEWISNMRGSEQDPIHHQEGDVLTHTKMVTKEVMEISLREDISEEESIVLFWTSLLHDVAKPLTMKKEDGRVTNRGHSKIGSIMARNILWKRGFPVNLREQVCALISYHQIPFWLIDKERHFTNFLLSEISYRSQNRLLSLFAEADMKGRISADKNSVLDNISLFAEMSRDLDCYNRQRCFSSDYARIRYFNNYENINLTDEPFDILTDKFTVYFMSGIPGSGKSTFSKKLNLPIISLDSIRSEMKISATENQGLVIQESRKKAREFLRKKQSFVFDSTNLSKEIRGFNTNLCLSYGAKISAICVESSFKEIMKRNSEREKDMVPQKAIDKMLSKWEYPSLAEFHEISIIQN
jgi:putative nucleotidyltransferase with HDIG domain